MNTKQIGDLGERIAGAYLILKGYEIVGRNYRYAGREIDLLVRRGVSFAAVEVKLRRGRRFGAAVEAVGSKKLARIQTALAGVLAGMSRMDEAFERTVEPRVDLVVIDFHEDSGDMTIRHLEAVG